MISTDRENDILNLHESVRYMNFAFAALADEHPMETAAFALPALSALAEPDLTEEEKFAQIKLAFLRQMSVLTITASFRTEELRRAVEDLVSVMLSSPGPGLDLSARTSNILNSTGTL